MNWLRRIVSGDKRRLKNDKFDLDFTYITSRVIAMAFPAEGFESTYRNSCHDVAAYLELAHSGHYRIYNLSERKYNYDLFRGNVVDCGFPDHHNPPIQYLYEIIRAMDQYLSEDARNVIIIHCLAGRGRTGTVIACYLTYTGLFDNGTEALDFFARKRSRVDRGVNQPSQRRYVQYFSEINQGRYPLALLIGRSAPNDTGSDFSPISSGFDMQFNNQNIGNNAQQLSTVEEQNKVFASFKPQSFLELSPELSANNSGALMLKAVILYTVPKFGRLINGCSPVLEMYTAPTQFVAKRLLYTSATTYDQVRAYVPKDGRIVFHVNTVLRGDVYLRCYHVMNSALTKAFMFRLSFHTGFVPSNSVLRLTKYEIDDACNDSRFDKDFFMELVFEKIPNSDTHHQRQQQISTTNQNTTVAANTSAADAGFFDASSYTDSIIDDDLHSVTLTPELLMVMEPNATFEEERDERESDVHFVSSNSMSRSGSGKLRRVGTSKSSSLRVITTTSSASSSFTKNQ